MAFTLRLSPDDLADIDRAAQAQGVSRAAFVTRAALEAARQRFDSIEQLARQVAEIHKAVCGGLDDERAAAVAALVQMGWTDAKAKRRVAALPDGPAEELIVNAMKEN